MRKLYPSEQERALLHRYRADHPSTVFFPALPSFKAGIRGYFPSWHPGLHRIQ